MKLLKEGNPTPKDCHDMTRERMESAIRVLRMIMKFEQIGHRRVPLPIISWARSRYAAMPGITPSGPNNYKPGRWPDLGFAGDAPK